MSDELNISLIIHNVRSAYNVGSIFRSADAAGISKIYICGYSPTPPHPGIAKTALGAELFLPWEHYSQRWRLLKKLHKAHVKIVALEQNTHSLNLFDYKPIFPIALMIGHERQGLSSTILSYVDNIVEIPMHGKKESLNVAVATGIALYHLRFSL